MARMPLFLMLWGAVCALLLSATARGQDSNAAARLLEARERSVDEPERDLPAEKSLPLATRKLPERDGVSHAEPRSETGSLLLNLVGSLAVVLGLFLGVIWFLRRSQPKGSAQLPREVFEVLGRAPLAGRQQAQLVRCGNKLLLLSVTGGGSETLTEITDAAEVDRLAGLCQQSRPTSATATFRNMFSQFSAEASTGARSSRASARSDGALTRLEVGDA